MTKKKASKKKAAPKGPSGLEMASQALLDSIQKGRPGQKECRLVKQALAGQKFSKQDMVFLTAE